MKIRRIHVGDDWSITGMEKDNEVRTDNDFLLSIGQTASGSFAAVPLVGRVEIKTRQQAYRTAAWLKVMADMLPNEPEGSEYDEIETAIRAT